MKKILSATDILERLGSVYRVSTDTELSRMLGVAKQSIAVARKRNHVPEEWVIEASRKTGVSLDELFYGEKLHEQEDYVTIPRVSATLSAGGGSFETEADIVSWYSFRKEWIRKKGGAANLVLMNVSGDSMEPALYSGDLVMVNRALTRPEPYSIFAVRVDDAVYVKQLVVHPGKMVLRSLNPKYSDIEIPRSEDFENSFQILGKIVWFCHDVM